MSDEDRLPDHITNSFSIALFHSLLIAFGNRAVPISYGLVDDDGDVSEQLVLLYLDGKCVAGARSVYLGETDGYEFYGLESQEFDLEMKRFTARGAEMADQEGHKGARN